MVFASDPSPPPISMRLRGCFWVFAHWSAECAMARPSALLSVAVVEKSPVLPTVLICLA